MDKTSGYIYIAEDRYGVYYVGRSPIPAQQRIKELNHPMKGREPKIIQQEPYYNLTHEEINNQKKKLIKQLKKENKKILNNLYLLSQSPFRKVKIYTYHFPDGKVYIGYTSRSLQERHHAHKRCSISPIYKCLNTHEEVLPKYEKTVEVDIDSDEIYKIQRKILDKYTTDTNQILNPNLYLFGY